MYLSLVSVNVVAPQERFVAYVAAVALPLRGVHGEVAVVVTFVRKGLVTNGAFQVNGLSALSQ